MRRFRSRGVRALVVVALLAGFVAIAGTGTAAADNDDPLEFTRFTFGSYQQDVNRYLTYCNDPIFEPMLCTANPSFSMPDAFLDRVDGTSRRYGNTDFTCPPGRTCVDAVSRAVWVVAVRPGDGAEIGTAHGSTYVTIAGPPGTVFSDNPADYVMSTIGSDELELAENTSPSFRVPYRFVEDPARHPTSVQREALNRVRLGVSVGDTTGNRHLFVWMGNVENPPAGEYPGLAFRVSSSRQSTFSGSWDDDVEFTADNGIRENSTLERQSPKVTVGDDAVLIATLRDRYGNGVPDKDVYIEPVNGSAGLAGDVFTETDDDGKVRIGFVDRVAEQVEFRALALQERFVFEPTEVTFVPDVPDPTYTRVLDPPPVAADGTTAGEIVVRMADQFANPNLGDEVALIPEPMPGGPTNVFVNGTIAPAPGSVCTAPRYPVPGVSCALTPVTSTIVGPGGVPVRQAEVRFRVTSTAAETVRFRITNLTTAAVLDTYAVVTFTPGAPSASTIGPATQQVEADGTSTGSITVTVADAHANPIVGVPVTLSASAGSSAEILDDEITTGADGRAVFAVRSTEVEDVTFTAAIPSGAVAGAAVVQFVAGSPSAVVSTVEAAPTSRLANGQTPATITVRVVDALGRPVPDQAVGLTGSAGHQSTIAPALLPAGTSGCPTQAPAGTTDCDGRATFTVVDSTVETVTYTASLPGAGVTLTAVATVDFTPPPGIGTSTIHPESDSVPADGSTASYVVVTLRTTDGTPLAGKDVCLTQAAGTLPGAPPCPDGSAGSPPSTVTPVATTGCPPVSPGTTDCQGRARFAVTSTTPGTVTYGIVDLTDFPANALGPTTVVTFTAVPDEAGMSSVVTDVGLALADGGTTQAGTATVTVTLRSGAGAVLTDRPVDLAPIGASSAVVIPVAIPTSVSGCATQAVAGTSDCRGEARFEVVDTVPEIVEVRAVDVTNGIAVTQTARITFLPDEAAVSTVVAEPDTVLADGGASAAGVATVTVTLNPGPNPLEGHRVLLLQAAGGNATRLARPVPIGVSGCAVQQPAGTSDCNGTVSFTVTSSTIETVTFSAFDQTSGTWIDQTATVRFIDLPPVVASVDPSTGVPAGGTAVTITGSRFSTAPGATSITFGGTPATDVTCASTTTCTATTPPGPVGPVTVVVATASGASTPVSPGSDQFTYAVAVPAISSISPTSGPVSGGTVVTISGTNLAGATTVTFGTAVVPVQSVDGAGTTVTAIAPAAVAGIVDVRVTTPGGTTATGNQARYTYTTTNTPPRPPVTCSPKKPC